MARKTRMYLPGIPAHVSQKKGGLGSADRYDPFLLHTVSP